MKPGDTGMHANKRKLISMLALAPFVHGRARAADDVWPSRSITVIVPYPAGGGPDQLTRRLCTLLEPLLKTSFVVTNKPGASGMLGLNEVSQSAPNGYVATYFTSSQLTVQASGAARNFDILKSIQPITQFTTNSYALVVARNSPYQTFEQLLAAIQKSPGALNYGSAGVGSPNHLAMEYLRAAVPGLDALHVPYKGAVEVITALRSSQLDFSFALVAAAMPQIRSGDLRALAVTSAKRLEVLPEVRTLDEAGIKNYAYGSWGGLGMRAGTPKPIIEGFFSAVHTAVRDPQFQAYSQSVGTGLELSASPEAFSEKIRLALIEEEKTAKRLKQ
jgi:tripartite-type tricarboxylate transporter receptor subunit TctC